MISLLPLESDFHIQVYLITSSARGKLDLLLRDTITALREIGQGTENVNRYDYCTEEEDHGSI